MSAISVTEQLLVVGIIAVGAVFRRVGSRPQELRQIEPAQIDQRLRGPGLSRASGPRLIQEHESLRT